MTHCIFVYEEKSWFLKLNNIYKLIYYVRFLIISCLSFCSYYVSLVILGPDYQHG